jgi:hypothetical protein
VTDLLETGARCPRQNSKRERAELGVWQFRMQWPDCSVSYTLLGLFTVLLCERSSRRRRLETNGGYGCSGSPAGGH